jgi:type I restriction enzyme R subunit
MNRPLTATDLAELESILEKSGLGDAGMLARAKKESQGLGLFVRSLVGLDREAAKEALGDFLSGGRHTSAQIEFVNLIVNHITENGVMDAALLYESPFTDIVPQGPEQLFNTVELDRIVAALEKVKAAARVA